MTQHLHGEFVPDCYRCDLNRDEVPHPLWVEHGHSVAAARREIGLSQEMVARIADTTQQTISRIETGTQGVSDGLKVRIAKALGKKVADVFPLGEG